MHKVSFGFIFFFCHREKACFASHGAIAWMKLFIWCHENSYLSSGESPPKQRANEKFYSSSIELIKHISIYRFRMTLFVLDLPVLLEHYTIGWMWCHPSMSGIGYSDGATKHQKLIKIQSIKGFSSFVVHRFSRFVFRFVACVFIASHSLWMMTFVWRICIFFILCFFSHFSVRV